MKWIKRIILAGALLVIIVVVAVYFSLNAIVRAGVERQSTASLGVPTTLGSANLSLFGGKINLNDLEVGSPTGFSAPHVFTLDGIGVSVHYGQLRGSPIHIGQIVIDHPVLIIEQSNMKLNLKALMDQMPQTPKTSGGQPTEPVKLIIDELDLNNAEVTFRPGIPGLSNSVQVPVASMTLKNLGNADGNQNGIAIKEVAMQTMTALAAKATDAAQLPPEVKALLSGDLSGISQQIGGEFNKQFQNISGQLTKQLPSDVGNALKNTSGNGQNPLQQLLGGDKKNKN